MCIDVHLLSLSYLTEVPGRPFHKLNIDKKRSTKQLHAMRSFVTTMHRDQHVTSYPPKLRCLHAPASPLPQKPNANYYFNSSSVTLLKNTQLKYGEIIASINGYDISRDMGRVSSEDVYVLRVVCIYIICLPLEISGAFD